MADIARGSDFDSRNRIGIAAVDERARGSSPYAEETELGCFGWAISDLISILDSAFMRVGVVRLGLFSD
jgi:hypothetical protein